MKDKTRRHFLSLTAATALSPLAVTVWPHRSAHAFVATLEAAATILSVASTVAQFVGPKGPSSIDMGNIQVDLLKGISNQIAAVNSGIVDLAKSLQDVKELIKEVPDDVVRTATRTEAGGALKKSAENLAALTQDMEELRSFTKAIDGKRDDLIAANQRLDNVRTTLIGNNHKWYVTIPVVSSIMRAQLEQSILTDRSEGTITALLSNTSQWFGVKSGQLSNEISLLRGQIDKLKKKLDKFVNDYPRVGCKQGNIEYPFDLGAIELPPEGERPKAKNTLEAYYCANYDDITILEARKGDIKVVKQDFDKITSNKELGVKMSNDFAEIVEKGYLNKDEVIRGVVNNTKIVKGYISTVIKTLKGSDIPWQPKVANCFRKGGSADDLIVYEFFRTHFSEHCPGDCGGVKGVHQGMHYCSRYNVNAVKEEKDREVEAMSNELNRLTVQLVVHASLQYCADEAADFAQKQLEFRREAK